MVERCTLVSALMVLSLIQSNDAFSVLPNKNPLAPPLINTQQRQSLCRLFALPEIKDMRIKEMRAELDGYGISTRTFLEKREFLDALEKARAGGTGATATATATATNGATKSSTKAAEKKDAGKEYANAYSYYNKNAQKESNGSSQASNGQAGANGTAQKKANGYAQAKTNGSAQTKANGSSQASNSHSDPSNGTVQKEPSQTSDGSAQTDPKTNQNKNNKKTKASGGAGASRAERLQAELENAKAMRVSELKQKLNKMGVSTTSFFEKTEFVRAYAEAVVDGFNGSAKQGAGFDAEYRDVVMQKFDPKTQQSYLLGGTIIDIKL